MKLRRYLSGLAALAMATTGMTALSVAAPAAAADGDGTVKIQVVQDYNANGTWDDPFVEPGLAGVAVKVTGPGGTQNLTTDSDGLITVVGAPGDYRIDVANPDPSKLQPAFAWKPVNPTDTPPANALSSNDDFVTVEADETATVTTGFWDAGDYCQSNPLIVDACQQPIFNGGGGLNANDAAETLFTAPYRGNGNDVGKTQLSTQGDTGTVYGIGYRQQDKRIFAGAYAKAGSAYGPGGPGAIYVVSADGGPTTQWGNVPDAGTSEHHFNAANLRQDWDFAPAAGKESLGDLDISEDGKDLQVINLNNRKLYVYDATAATMGAPTHVVDLSANPGCSAASDWRPGALAERKGVLYVGGVCSAESTQDPNDMRAIILTYNASTYESTGKVMDQTINRKRTSNAVLASTCQPRDSADGVASTSFRPWSNKGLSCDPPFNGRGSDPQAWMDDIVVDNNGDLTVAFRDRTGDQLTGAGSRFFTNTDGTGDLVATVDYVVAGDVNKACKNDSGMYVLDINGACGIAAVAPDQVTGEFYTGDGGVHPEAAFGGIALSRGERGIVTSSMDPAGGFFTQGYSRLDRATGRPLASPDGGTKPDSPEVLEAPNGNNGGNHISGADGFSKGQGMADIEVLCDLAPIQIGNRVWSDTNKDGIQDPGEPGIAGVTVNLYDKDGNKVATTVTDSQGEYYFDSAKDKIDFNTDYTIRLDNPDDYAPDGPLDSTVTKLTVADSGSGGSADQLDSDGKIVDGFPDHAITTGDHGDVDHSYDFGFVTPSVSVGDYVWFDQDGDGVQGPNEDGIKGVVLTLTGPDGKPVTDVNGKPVGPQTTDDDGKYSFDALPPLPAGQHYTVTIDQNASSDALEGFSPTRTGQGTNGTDSSTDSATSGDLTKDGDRDGTLDFGFTKPNVSVGDYVWADQNKDGIQDPGEHGIPGVVLKLTGPDGQPVTDVNGKPVAPVTTDADGKYSFDALPPLEAGQHYTVTVDKDASKDALKGFSPTKTGQGTDATDSSTDSATSGDLVNDGDRDSTLDFGFISPSVSVGDYVWADQNKDGIQDTGEDGIPGVVLKLTGPDGKPVTDVNGNPVGPQTTDADGKYSFDNLPPLDAGQHYTVSIDKGASKDALKGFSPTKTGQGTDATDSSTDSATSGDLVNDGDRDSTLDFGFIKPAVSVGDYLWVDTDGDGVQDAGEPGIPGVVLTLTGPDGKPVTDVNGKPVGPVTTDADGKYSFDDLPTLGAGQHYTVTIDKEASKDALKGFAPTKTGKGTRATDSSTNSATSGDLTKDGDRDGTLDFGFVPVEVVDGTVWVDKDTDGKVDKGETRLPGVVIVLTGPDGKPVTDIHGNPVGPVTTDKDGNYSFPDLPKLPGGQSYQTSVDADASKDALKGYNIDPTDPLNPFDFGFVPVAPPAAGGGSLPFTGLPGGMASVGAAAALILAGGVALVVARRRRTAR